MYWVQTEHPADHTKRHKPEACTYTATAAGGGHQEQLAGHANDQLNELLIQRVMTRTHSATGYVQEL